MRTKKLKKIKILVWDVDGTLYQSIPYLSSLIKKTQLKILSRAKNKPVDQVISRYLKLKKKYKSGTIVLHKLGCGSYKSILTITESMITKKFIKRDPKLLEMFSKLGFFRHLILANKVKMTTLRQLNWLGLSPNFFEKILTIEDFKVTKPSLKPFKAVLDYTKLPADQHLMIGDRVEVDLVPAKKLGMRICLVWQGERVKNKNIDITIPTVYDIVKVLS